MLSERIVEEFHKNNRVFASHLVSFIAFKYWREKFPQMDLFSFLRLPEDELEIDYQTFRSLFEEYRNKVLQLRKEKKIKVGSHLKSGDIDEMIRYGLKSVGLYHMKRPLMEKDGKIVTQDLTTLYYYHNRTEGYGL